MAFQAHFLDDIKNRIAVSSVVGRRVKLQRRGREYVGLSPFKAEKTPSFTVNDDKQFYHCFATGKHGSIFDFVMETEGLSFPEAVERLAGEAGLAMPEYDQRQEERHVRQKTLVDWLDKAAAWFHAQLAGHAQAKQYLRDRGLDDAIVKRFGLGYAPTDRQSLTRHLLDQGAEIEVLIEAGLAIQPDDGRAPYDRFRDRIMFPIHDARARIIGFGGRAMSADAQAKYLNSPETPVFHKGGILYNFHRARQPSYDSKQLLVTEGYMDVIGLAQAGFDAAVAPLGTAVTEQQIELLWRLTPEPIMCLDGDAAGLRAAYRVIDRALPLLKPGVSLRFALLPDGQDPDDLVRMGGRAAMESLLEQARPLSEMLWMRELERMPLNTPERRADFKGRLRQAVALIEHRDVRAFYGQDIKERLDQFFTAAPANPQSGFDQRNQWSDGGRPLGRAGSGRLGRVIPRQETRLSALAQPQQALSARPALLVAGVLCHPELLLGKWDSVFERIEILDPDLMRVRDLILSRWSAGLPLDMEGLKGHLKGLAPDTLLARIDHLACAHGLPFTNPRAEGTDVEASWLEVAELHHTLTTLEREKSEAEADFASDGRAESFDRLRAIVQEIAAIENQMRS